MDAKSDFTHWLSDLDLSRVVLSADMTSDGELKPVGGMLAKLSAAEETLRAGVLETMVLAEGQFFPEDYRTLPHLRVLKADTLHAAAQRLREQHGPHAAGLPVRAGTHSMPGPARSRGRALDSALSGIAPAA